MKTHYFFLILLIIFVPSADAQKIRYTDTSNVWTLTFDVWDTDSAPMSSFNISYCGDTVVNGLTYYKQDDFFWVREDTITGQVFYCDSFVNGEKLLFDYNMAVGDTLLSYSYMNFWQYGYVPDTFVLSSLGSVLLGNVAHIVQHFVFIKNGTTWGTTIVIEGLGCFEGARMPIPTHVNPGYVISCFQNKGSHPDVDPILYSFFDNVNSCNVLSVRDSKLREPTVNIFPSPVSSISSMVFSRHVTGNLKIMNSVGQAVVSIDLSNRDKFSFAELDLVPSVYFYVLTDLSRKEMYTGKFVFE